MRPASEFPMVGSNGVNLTGIPGGAGADSEGLMGGAKVGCGKEVPSPPKKGSAKGGRPLQGKLYFHLKWRVLVHSERYFCLCPRQKKC